MTRFSIVVPVLNEERIIEAALEELDRACRDCGGPELWDVVVCDAGSADRSQDVARNLCRRHGWTFVDADLARPSIAATVKAGLARCIGRQVLVLPADCSLDAVALVQWRQAVAHGAVCGGFAKSYVPPSPVLRLYAGLQNAVLLRWRKELVWTNGMFFARELGDQLGQIGFLDDVVFSDFLRRQLGWRALPGPIHVSARRYDSGPLRQICLNGLILAAYRAGVADALTLRRIYRDGICFGKGDHDEERLGDGADACRGVRDGRALQGAGRGVHDGDNAPEPDDGPGAESWRARRHEVRG